MPKPKRGKTGSLPKTEWQDLQKMYTKGAAGYRCERNLSRACNLPISNLSHFLRSKTSDTKLTLATRKVERMKAFAGFKNQIWFMDLVFVDKLAKKYTGIKYLLVH